MRNALLGAAALVALAGCGGGESGGGEMSAEEVAAEVGDVKLQPGQWEMKQEILAVEAPGMPPEAVAQMKQAGNTVQTCITPEQANSPRGEILAAQKDTNCTYADWSMKDGRMTGTMTCSPEGAPGKMVTAVDGRYQPTSYDLTVETRMEGMPGGTMTMKARTSARRIGECA